MTFEVKMSARGSIVAAGILLAVTCAEVRAGDREKVEALVIEFGNAYRDGNAEIIDDLLADEYSHINNGGRPIDREAYLGWNEKRKAKLGSGAWSVSTYEISELKVTVFGDSAVATGLVTASGERDGKAWQSKVRFTHLWIKDHGAWKRAAFHDTKLDDGAPAAEE